jgi:hypothetical protein
VPAKRSSRARHRLALAGSALIAAIASSWGAAEVGADAAAVPPQQALTPVTASVLSPPRWYRADDGRFHLSYELELTNAVPVPVTVTSLEVLRGGGGRIAALSGARLEQAMSPLASPDEPKVVLPPSSVGVAWIDLGFRRRGQIPNRVKHRLTVDVGPDLPVGPLITDTGGGSEISHRKAIEISAPVQGGRWVAIVGPHRRALQPVNGSLRNGQRFAIDFSARLDNAGRTHVADPDQNGSYFNYRQPVLAIGRGRVVEAVDRYPDQIPNHPTPVTGAAANGNHVILKLGKGVFAAYAHLAPGSVRVQPGDRVGEGQAIGRLGNSGGSHGPHLHFQVMSRPSILDSDGLPFVIDRFRLNGRIPSLEAFIEADASEPRVPPVPIDHAFRGRFRNRGLTDLDVVTFPGR